MIQGTRVIDAIKSSGIKKVTLLDDAFDMPRLAPDDYAALLDILEMPDEDGGVKQLELSAQQVELATSAIHNNEFDDDHLVDTVRHLHTKFLSTRDDCFDPMGKFRTASANLADVDPLLRVLGKAGVSLQLVGLETVLPDDDVELPDLIFADYFLDPHITSANDGSDGEREQAKTASLSRLDEILQPSRKAKRHPPVILMSSKDVKDRADEYRGLASNGEGKVYASRFGFIRKTDLKIGERPHPRAPEPVEIARPSADVLLDIIQSHPFGQRLHEALKLWIAGSQAAVDQLKSDIEEMELRDFAYLVTHRLAQEEIGLFDYLEWFFGECLLGTITDVFAKDETRPTRTTLDENAVSIEGAYDGRTDRVADLYHRARVSTPRNRANEDRMGDLYVERSEDGLPTCIWAILTPDCDLIVRGGARRAKQLLTIHGTLTSYDAPKASVADFILVDTVRYSIDWDPKNLVTREDMSGLDHVGSLRPLYAQDLQRRALNDLSRIGLAVPPTIRMTATYELWVKTPEETMVVAPGAVAEKCEVFPSRGGADVARVMLSRAGAEEVAALIQSLAEDVVHPDVRDKLRAAKKKGEQEAIRSKLAKGVVFDQDLSAGVVVSGSASAAKHWCVIKVQMVEVVPGEPKEGAAA